VIPVALTAQQIFTKISWCTVTHQVRTNILHTCSWDTEGVPNCTVVCIHICVCYEFIFCRLYPSWCLCTSTTLIVTVSLTFPNILSNYRRTTYVNEPPGINLSIKSQVLWLHNSVCVGWGGGDAFVCIRSCRVYSLIIMIKVGRVC